MMYLRRIFLAIALVAGFVVATTPAIAAAAETPDEPAEESPKEKKAKAEERLKEKLKEAKRNQQITAKIAGAHYDAAKKAYDAGDYIKAVEEVEQALSLMPDFEAAKDLAYTVRAILSRGNDKFKSALKDLSDIRRVGVQNSLVIFYREKGYADRYLARAQQHQEGDDDRSKELLYSRKIGDVQTAISKYERAREIIRWMPYSLNNEQEAEQIEAGRREARNLLEQFSEALRKEKRYIAKRSAIESRTREKDIARKQVSKMLELAQIEFDKGNYDEAESACQIILKEGANSRASELVSECRSRRHQERATTLEKMYIDQKRRTFQDVDEALIPFTGFIIYSKNWGEIRKRSGNAGSIDTAKDPEWAQSIKLGLDQKVTFEFTETPFIEAIQFIQTLTKINIIVDSQIEEGTKEMPVSLRVTDMSLGLALNWILRSVSLSYAIKDHALFISERQNTIGNVVLRMYDVRDLTAKVSDFPGPNLILSIGESGGDELISDDFGEDEEGQTAEGLAEMIRERINPDVWAEDQGTSIEERDGKLVVMQRPDVHRLIDHLLSSFRAAQKLFVVVEGRFLELREGFFEESGIDFGSAEDGGVGLPNNVANPLAGPVGTSELDSDTLLGDYTTMTTGVVPTPTTANIFGHGNLSVLGTVSNYRPLSAPEATKNAPTGRDQDYGLNMQIRRLGDIEVMAFLHAMNKRTGWSNLMAPKLTVMNTQRAHMFVAEQISYVADYEVQGDNFNPVIGYYLQGIVFDVKPIVSADRRYVTLELQPALATWQSQTDYTIDAVVSLGGGSIIRYPLLAPNLGLQRIRTTVTIPDGGIMYIGGMMKSTKYKSENGVPFLSNLPVVGKLFRWDIQDNERSSLSILVTAKILIFEEIEAELQ